MSKHVSDSSRSSHLILLGVGLAIIVCLCAAAFLVLSALGGGWMLEAVSAQEISTRVRNEQNQRSSVINATPFQPLPTTTNTPTPSPTPTPLPTPTQQPTPTLAAEWGSIKGFYGYAQLYTLDCEARSAVDWAAFFGVRIDELEFISKMPKSDDPESGFVGNINGLMGQFPPKSYGVHAAPIAQVLRGYGVPADAVKKASFEDIKREILAGRPVITWIVNLPYPIETMEYTAESTGVTSKVARFEHTWIITAFDSRSVTVVDSEWTYKVILSTFLERWAALDNMMIRYQP